ncbi:MAG TPA: hypothetical protein VK785_02940 [Opitutaceae bacterium]|jgi:hypothetical protein|nr:hypothetical protein [Opitutaceae bacterium]
METEIHEALLALNIGIARADGLAISAQTARLDELLARDRGRLHPQLAHFLERRSYAKALDWLGGTTPAAGTCAPRSKP